MEVTNHDAVSMHESEDANNLTHIVLSYMHSVFLGLLPATTSTKDISASRVPAVVVAVVAVVGVVEAVPKARDVKTRLLISLTLR